MVSNECIHAQRREIHSHHVVATSHGFDFQGWMSSAESWAWGRLNSRVTTEIQTPTHRPKAFFVVHAWHA
jgi:hypothetical protein